jgi:hypothetical protein
MKTFFQAKILSPRCQETPNKRNSNPFSGYYAILHFMADRENPILMAKEQ